MNFNEAIYYRVGKHKSYIFFYIEVDLCLQRPVEPLPTSSECLVNGRVPLCSVRLIIHG